MKLPPLHSAAPHFGRKSPVKPGERFDWLRTAFALGLLAFGTLCAGYSLVLLHPESLRTEGSPAGTILFVMALAAPVVALVAWFGGLRLLWRNRRRSR